MKQLHTFYISIISLVIVNLSILHTPAFTTSGPCTPEGVFSFAEHLEDTGDYYRAITEYRRFIHAWPNHELAGECRFRIGRSYLRGKDISSAINEFQIMYGTLPDSVSEDRVELALADAYYQNSQYRSAVNMLLNSSNNMSNRYSLSICYLRSNQPDPAISLWINDSSREAASIRQHIENFRHLPEKNPRLAGILSAILPGSGQCYAGRWRDGFVSFLINGLFIGAAVVAIEHNHEETAAIIGFFELGFYSANI